MKLDDFDYILPEELIAQKPVEKRDESRLLVVHRDSGEIEHRKFFNILDYLKEGDCLVLNDSKVLPARLFGRKKTGARVEVLLIKRLEGDLWEAMVKPGKKLKIGDEIDFRQGEESSKFVGAIEAFGDDGTRHIRFEYDGMFMERLEELGSMPLPPYIERKSGAEDNERYQTVYCREEGSVAAPTAGLHFTEELLRKAEEKGVKLAYVTLHVGIGTFRPVKCENIEDHRMHFEEYHISKEAADIINRVKEEGGRIITVGTTSTRTLESAGVQDGVGNWKIKEGEGNTGIFIYPGYEFKIADSLITNFHLPKSTLLMLISALYDREKILKVYKEAVAERYRFFSYGDAMFIE